MPLTTVKQVSQEFVPEPPPVVIPVSAAEPQTVHEIARRDSGRKEERRDSFRYVDWTGFSYGI